VAQSSEVGLSRSSGELHSAFILCISIHSFIHSFNFYSASSSPLLLRGVPNTARILCRSFALQATASEWLAQGSYVAAKLELLLCKEPSIYDVHTKGEGCLAEVDACGWEEEVSSMWMYKQKIRAH